MKTVVDYGLIGADDYGALNRALAESDVQRFADIAVPLCERSILLYAHLFMGQVIPPHIAEKWEEIEKHPKTMVRIFRQGAKTTIFTNALVAQRVSYASVPGSIHENARILGLFETRDRAIDRVRPIKQLFSSGGPGGLIGAVFRGAEGTDWEGMTIPQMADKFGAWTDLTIDVPHPRGKFKPDPTLRALAPGMATVGFAPTDILMDDLVGTKTADSPKKTENLRRWVFQDVLPMAKPYTRIWVPHTVFREGDLNELLAASKLLYLLEVKALNRVPSRLDYEPVLDATRTVVDIKLSDLGKTLKSAWPCPLGDDQACDIFNPDHVREVGYHRPVKDLLLQYETDPVAFMLQYMHTVVASDQASIKPWMMRYYTRDPNSRFIGQVASWQKDWDRWVEEHPEQRLDRHAPRVLYLDPDGFVRDSRDGNVIDKVTACVQAWDLAFGKEKRNDFTVCATIYRTEKGLYFVVIKRGKWRHDTVWRMIGTLALTNPIRRPAEVGVEVNNFSQVYKEEGAKIMRELGIAESVRISEVRRSKDKDRVLAESGLPIAMMNGLVHFDIDDDEAIREVLSVMPDQSGGHDDVLDGVVNAFPLIRLVRRLTPGFLGEPTKASF